MTDPYEDLANAVILQAVKDWRAAVRTQKKHPRCQSAQITRQECEGFFLGDWFEALTEIDGSYLLRKLKQEEDIHDE